MLKKNSPPPGNRSQNFRPRPPPPPPRAINNERPLNESQLSFCHSLEIDLGRHYKIARADRICKLCRRHNVVAVEDESHVMFNCEAYNDIRNLYIDRDALTCANEYNFIKLMNADNAECIVKFANFVSYMFNTSAGVSGSLDSYCSLKPLCSGMGEVVPARTSPTLLPPSPRTVLSLSCFKVSQCINCRD